MRTLTFTLLLLALPVLAQDRRPLTVEDGDAWRSLTGTRLSERGAWALYGLSVADGRDGSLEVVETGGERRYVIERGSGARFDFDERFVLCRIAPEKETLKAWKVAKKEDPKTAGEEPQTALALLELESGARTDVARVRSFALPDEAGGWVAIHLMEPVKEEKEEEEEAEPEQPEQPAEEEAAPAEGEGEDEKKKDKKDKKPGTELVLRELATGDEHRFPHVVSYSFSKNGRRLAFATSTKEGDGDGLFALDLDSNLEPVALLTGEGEYKSITFAEDGAQLAFLANVDDYQAEQPRWTLYLSRDATSPLVTAGSPGLPAGWGVSPDRAPRFSKNGERLLFGSAPLPEPEPEEVDEEDKVTLDVWSWTDDRIQPQQLVQLQQDLKRSYLALVHLSLGTPRVVQLATPEVPDVRLGDEDGSALALGSSDLPYRHVRQWSSTVPRDLYRVDVASGRRTLLVEGALGRASLSPGGHWVTWWDGEQRQLLGVELASGGEPKVLTAGIPHPLWNELHDSPSLPRSYGTGGWLTGDVGLLVYDKHDVWLIDPTEAAPVVCVTEGLGRREGWRFRRVDLDPEEASVSPMENLLLSAFHLQTKRAGFFRDRLIGGGEPQELLTADKSFGTPTKARDGDVLRFTRQDFVEYPDLWVSDLDLGGARKLSQANTQQAEFNWGSARLVDWRSTDGTPLQGILYTPDDFDPTRKHPLLVYFYERMSDRLHSYNNPIPSRSSVRFPYYTSNGYCVFVPDIPYRIGYPGPSCCDAVLPGVLSLIDEGFIDENAIGVQGHSWGGYQIAYMVTQSNLFTAGVAGAPVSNMTSAYGGIRWASGMSRQFQYEQTQSRLGGSLWEVPNRYFENSPVFFADKVETPLLMLHNDKDGAVPWYQGIEYFVALKRLDKPVWLLNYNGEGHGIGKYAHRRDYARRMSQFFDHYLRGAAAPEWMVHGVPATAKGRDLGLELVPKVEGE